MLKTEVNYFNHLVWSIESFKHYGHLKMANRDAACLQLTGVYNKAATQFNMLVLRSINCSLICLTGSSLGVDVAHSQREQPTPDNPRSHNSTTV